MPYSRLPAPAVRLAAAVLLLGPPWSAAAQEPGEVLRGSPAELSATPEDAARSFLRSVRAIRWDAAALFLHPATLDRFALVVRVISDPDTTGRVREYLVQTDSAGLAALPPAEIFERALDATISGMPGLMHAVFDRDDAVVGHVAEGADTAHVVYRTTARISGATPEVKVMQLARTEAGWRVLWSDELEVLEAALRGVARPARGPPGDTARLGSVSPGDTARPGSVSPGDTERSVPAQGPFGDTGRPAPAPSGNIGRPGA